MVEFNLLINFRVDLKLFKCMETDDNTIWPYIEPINQGLESGTQRLFKKKLNLLSQLSFKSTNSYHYLIFSDSDFIIF